MFHSSALARGGAVLDKLGIYIELEVSYFEHLGFYIKKPVKKLSVFIIIIFCCFFFKSHFIKLI